LGTEDPQEEETGKEWEPISSRKELMWTTMFLVDNIYKRSINLPPMEMQIWFNLRSSVGKEQDNYRICIKHEGRSRHMSFLAEFSQSIELTLVTARTNSPIGTCLLKWDVLTTGWNVQQSTLKITCKNTAYHLVLTSVGLKVERLRIA